MEEQLNVAVNKLYRFSPPPSASLQTACTLVKHTGNLCFNSHVWLNSCALSYSQLHISTVELEPVHNL